jgi:hypothetical protein
MEVYGFIGDKRGKSATVEQILQALKGRLPKGAVNALLSSCDAISPENAPNARLAFTQSLRWMVDVWIHSAKTVDEEQPWKRAFEPLLLQDYLKRNPPWLQMTEKGPCLVMFPRVWDKRKRPPLATKVVLDSLGIELEDTQSPNVQFVREIMPSALDAATAMFLQLLDSSERTRLFRCDGCGTYFMRERMPKKDAPIKRGSWCIECTDKGGARRTDKSRERRTQQMLELAADAREKWKNDRRHGELSEWIVGSVNRGLPASWKPIAKNWVTRHKDEIEAEMNRRNHAKG